MTGAKISIVDIMMFCELETICTMYSRDVPPSQKKLRVWYEKLSEEASIKSVNAQFHELVKNNGLYYDDAAPSSTHQ